MKHVIQISVAVIIALIIGGITVAVADHVEQSNVVLVQGQQAEQIKTNTGDISVVTSDSRDIAWKLEAIYSTQQELKDTLKCKNY